MVVRLAIAIIGTVSIIHVLIAICCSIDRYDSYCHGCHCGWCTEEPKSKECQKWRDEIENKNNESSDNQ